MFVLLLCAKLHTPSNVLPIASHAWFLDTSLKSMHMCWYHNHDLAKTLKLANNQDSQRRLLYVLLILTIHPDSTPTCMLMVSCASACWVHGTVEMLLCTQTCYRYMRTCRAWLRWHKCYNIIIDHSNFCHYLASCTTLLMSIVILVACRQLISLQKSKLMCDGVCHFTCVYPHSLVNKKAVTTKQSTTNV